jgi:predicted ABC-type ATPase
VKEIIIIAGPNGSGKSTLASQLDIQCVFISADDCEKRILSNIGDKSQREQMATVMVGKEINASIKNGISFAFETVFATNTIPSFLKTAKEKGYEITLHYVSTESTDINISRVADRVRDGGHDVPKEKIIERYSKSISILPNLLEFVDTAYIYDNSENKIRAFLVKENNQFKTISTVPNWAKNLSM